MSYKMYHAAIIYKSENKKQMKRLTILEMLDK